MPELIEIDHWPHGNTTRCAPLLHRIFRPEDQHGGSGINDVLPPARGGHGKVEDTRLRHGLPVFDFKRHRFAGVSVGGLFVQPRAEFSRGEDGDSPISLER